MKKANKFIDLFWSGIGGIGIGFIVSTIVSAFIGTGEFYPVAPSFQQQYDQPLTAVIIAMLLYALLGMVGFLSSIIYKNEKISLLARGILHFATIFIIISTAGKFLHWYTLDWKSFGCFALMFLVIYFIIWTLNYFQIKNDIKRLNQEIDKRK